MALSSAGDDYSDSFDSSGTVEINSEVTGNLEVIRDKDWFRVDLLAGNQYVFRVVRSDENSTLDEPFLVLRDENGNFISQDGSIGDGPEQAALAFEPTTSGVYWLEARSVANDTGEYRVLVESQDDIFGDDFGDNADETTPLPLNSLISGQIDEDGDQDWLRVSLTAGQEYTLDISDSDIGNSAFEELYIVVRDADGGFVAQAGITDLGGRATASFTPIVSGTYSIIVRDFGGGTGKYALSVTDQNITGFEDPSDEGDIPSNITSNATLVVGENYGGTISTLSDSDWYKVSLTADTEYLITVETPSVSFELLREDGVLVETHIIIRDADGAFITEEFAFGDENSPNLVSFVPQESGDYWVDIRGFSDKGSYIVSLSESGAAIDDFAGDITSTGTLSIGGSVAGELEVEGDKDWFAITLEGGFEYLFVVDSDPFKQPPEINLVLRDSNGNFLSQFSGFADNNLFSFEVRNSGDYWIEIQSVNDALFDNIGTYEISYFFREPLNETAAQALVAPTSDQNPEGYSVSIVDDGLNGLQISGDI